MDLFDAMRTTFACWNWQAFDIWLNSHRLMIATILSLKMKVLVIIFLLTRHRFDILVARELIDYLLASSIHLLLRDFQHTKNTAHSIAYTFFGNHFGYQTCTECSHSHCSLVRLHLNDLLIRGHRIAYSYLKTNNSGLSDRFTELRHQNGNFRHDVIELKT